MLVIGSAVQVAACRGPRLHTVSGRLCSSRRPPKPRAPTPRPAGNGSASPRAGPAWPRPGSRRRTGRGRTAAPARRNGGHRVVGQPVLQGLRGDRAPGDRAHDLVDQEVVRSDLAADHGLAEAPGRVDGDLRPVAVQRVQGERHPGGARPHHLLHADAHRYVGPAVASLKPVGDAAVGEQARPAAEHVPDDLVAAAHPQVGVVLAGEARVRLVLAGRRGADRDGQVAVPAPLAQPRVRGPDRAGQVGGYLERSDQRPRLRSGRRDRGRIMRVDRRGQGVQLPGEAAVGQRLAIAVGRDREAGRYRQSGAEQGAEGGVLAAEHGGVRGQAVIEPQDLCQHDPQASPPVALLHQTV